MAHLGISSFEPNRYDTHSVMKDTANSEKDTAGVDNWMVSAVEGIQCQAPHCDAYPVAERNGRNLCAKHRDHDDHSTSGKPCERCGSRHWVKTPNAASHAVCATCDLVVYDEETTKNSW